MLRTFYVTTTRAVYVCLQKLILYFYIFLLSQYTDIILVRIQISISINFNLCKITYVFNSVLYFFAALKRILVALAIDALESLLQGLSYKILAQLHLHCKLNFAQVGYNPTQARRFYLNKTRTRHENFRLPITTYFNPKMPGITTCKRK